MLAVITVQNYLMIWFYNEDMELRFWSEPLGYDIKSTARSLRSAKSQYLWPGDIIIDDTGDE